MQPPEENSRISKVRFFIADLVLVVAAFFIAMYSASPLGTFALVGIVICVALAAYFLCIPFVLDYRHDRDATLDARQQALEALARTTAETAEQIGIVATGLHTISELTQKSVQGTENLPQKIQEKVQALAAQFAENGANENKALQREIKALRASETGKLEAGAERIAQATAELAKYETTLREQLATLDKATARLTAAIAAAQAAAATVAQISPAETAETATESQPAPPARRKRAKTTAESTEGVESTGETASQPTNSQVEAKPVQTAPEVAPIPATEVASQKPEPNSTESNEPKISSSGGHGMLEIGLSDDTPLSPVANYPTRSPFATSAPFAFPTRPPPESALSSDGATHLLVTAYIGIGNKLFVRGDGPGLSLDKGQALQFVSIGKWRWETAEAKAPFTVRLYKNDQQESPLGPIPLQPGRQHEVTTAF